MNCNWVYFTLLIVLICPKHVSAQPILVKIPQENITADSLAHYIYQVTHGDPKKDKYGIAYSRKFGWLKMSEKINTDSFYHWTKNYCIERVGETFFYRHFRFDYHAMKDNSHSEIFEIRYHFLPFDTSEIILRGDSIAYTLFVFKSYDFLGIHEVQVPPNLPDCKNDPWACFFLFDRNAVKKIIQQKGIVSRKGYLPNLAFQPDMTWKVLMNMDDWEFHEYSVDSRSGVLSKVRIQRRID